MGFTFRVAMHVRSATCAVVFRASAGSAADSACEPSRFARSSTSSLSLEQNKCVVQHVDQHPVYVKSLLGVNPPPFQHRDSSLR